MDQQPEGCKHCMMLLHKDKNSQKGGTAVLLCGRNIFTAVIAPRKLLWDSPPQHKVKVLSDQSQRIASLACCVGRIFRTRKEPPQHKMRSRSRGAKKWVLVNILATAFRECSIFSPNSEPQKTLWDPKNEHPCNSNSTYSTQQRARVYLSIGSDIDNEILILLVGGRSVQDEPPQGHLQHQQHSTVNTSNTVRRAQHSTARSHNARIRERDVAKRNAKATVVARPCLMRLFCSSLTLAP